MVLNVEEWKLTREKVKNKLYETDRNELSILKERLANVSNSDDKANLYWLLFEKYKLLFWGYTEEVAIFKDTIKEEYYKQLEKDYLWNAIYYREKCLQIIKRNEAIEANDQIFMDVGLKYRYFIKYDYDEIKEDGLRFEKFGNVKKEKINIIINDISYAIRGMYYEINYFEKSNDHEELFCLYEIMGDLYLIIRLLLIEGGRKDLLDNGKQALMYYKESREVLKFYAKPTISYEGIYGLSYQVNFFEPLLKTHGFRGFFLSSIDKMEFIEKVLLKKESGMEYKEYSHFLDNKLILENRISNLTDKYPILIHKQMDFEDWKTVLYFVHDKILSFNFEQRNINNILASWKGEADMQKWIQLLIDTFIREMRNDPPFFTVREPKKGGGNCDHTYRRIPICDKWKRDTNSGIYPTKIAKFIDKVYNEHYGQVKSYADDIKLAVMIVVDSRQETRNKSPDMVRDCYSIKVNQQDGIITAIFVVQVSDIPPSKRK